MKAWPADNVVMRDAASLQPYEHNARTHTDEQIAQIAASIKEWGWTMPVLIDEGGTILAGHGRIEAAKRMKLSEVPCLIAEGWDEAQKRAYVIADNKLTLNGGWDLSTLGAEFEALKDADFKLSLTGFGLDEIGDILAKRVVGLTDPDDAPEEPEEPRSVAGDVWALGNHRLICGDATDADTVAKCLDGVQPHLMVTDPPYGVEYDADWRNRAERANGQPYGASAIGKVSNDGRSDWREAWALFPGDVAYVWHAGTKASEVADSLRASGFEIRSQIIWDKGRIVISRGHYHVGHEPCWYAVRSKGHWQGSRSESTVWRIEHRKSDTGHSTQKPVEAMRKPIENNSAPGQAVYEPFSGSGTTIIAAEMTGRVCHAIELDPSYVDVAVMRWQNFTGQTATHVETGEPFDG